MENFSFHECVQRAPRVNFGLTWDRVTHPALASDVVLQIGADSRFVDDSPIGFAIGLLATSLADALPEHAGAVGHDLVQYGEFKQIKYSSNPRRNWVYVHEQNKIVIKYGGNQEENRMQFEYLNYLRQILCGTRQVVVPDQYTLIETPSMSAIVMEYMPGVPLSSKKQTKKEKTLEGVNELIAQCAGTKAALALINDIGHSFGNGHYNNILVPTKLRDGVVLIDVPNMDTQEEIESIRSAAVALNAFIGSRAVGRQAQESPAGMLY